MTNHLPSVMADKRIPAEGRERGSNDGDDQDL